MNPSVLHEKCVLVLNRNWQAISIVSPAEAFGNLASGGASALDIHGADSMNPVEWDQWRLLEVRDQDHSVGTAQGAVRIPTIIVLKTFARVPMYQPKFSLKSIWMRDQGHCQYSGRKLKMHEASIDHVVPRSRGGATSWENCVLAERRLNSDKGDRTPAEAGLKLTRKPCAPRAVPITATLKNTMGIPHWDLFLMVA